MNTSPQTMSDEGAMYKRMVYRTLVSNSVVLNSLVDILSEKGIIDLKDLKDRASSELADVDAAATGAEDGCGSC